MHPVAVKAVFAVKPVIATSLVSDPSPDQLLSEFLIRGHGFLAGKACHDEQATR
jgi:hypothetical protein